MKNKTTILLVAILVYLPAVILVAITDFDDKNLLVRSILISTLSAVFFSVIRYYFQKNKKLN